MNPFPVTFGELYFPQITITANPTYESSDESPIIEAPVESNLAVKQIPNEPNRYVAELRVSLPTDDNRKLPYAFNILCITSLTVDDNLPTDEREKAVIFAAHAMTFPAVRELIITLTSRQPWGQLSIGLSSINPAIPNPTETPKAKKPKRKSIKGS